MIRTRIASTLLPILIGLAACGGERGDEPVEDLPAEGLRSNGTVLRSPAAPEEAPAPPAPDETVIQTQEGSPGNIHVDLTRARVTGDILTVQLRFRNTTDRHTTVRFPVDEVNYVDDASARRYSVLEDETGAPMASPLSQDRIVLHLSGEQTAVAWFRFAAPDPASQTISISIPGVGPFDGIPVGR
jgi:hypothetical protein